MEPFIIARIDETGPTRRARLLVAMGEEQSRTTSAAVVRQLRLEVGETVVPHELVACEAQCSRDRAMRLLSSCERSRHDVRERLLADGYPAGSVDSLCDRLEDLGLINDSRFAGMLVRTRLRSGFGPRRLRMELRRHGVDDDIAAAALAEESLVAGSVLPQLIARQAGSTPVNRDKLVRRFVARGFAVSEVIAALDEANANE